MTEPKTAIPQGTLDLLILRTLALETQHGLGITRRIQQITRGTFRVSVGSIFPALHRMEESGWVRSHWGPSDNNRKARFYALTPRGRRQLKIEAEQWDRVVLAVSRILEA